MAQFYGLVLDRDAADPLQWRVSTSDRDPACLRTVRCYADPAAPYSKMVWQSVSQEPLAAPILPCVGSDDDVPQMGTIHGFVHV